MPFWNVFYTLDSSSFLWLLKSAKGRASQVALVVKNPLVNAGDIRDEGSITGSGSSPWVGNGNSLQYSCLENLMDREAWWAAVFFPGKFSGQRSLVGYSPWNCKELDMSEHTHTYRHIFVFIDIIYIHTYKYISIIYVCTYISTHMCVYIVAVVVRVCMQLNVPLLLPVYLPLKSWEISPSRSSHFPTGSSTFGHVAVRTFIL